MPKGPTAGSFEWLRTSNINKALKKYEKAHPDFVFFGPVPINFSEIVTELNGLNLSRLYKNGIRSIGIIFNMDPHTQGGSHWVKKSHPGIPNPGCLTTSILSLKRLGLARTKNQKTTTVVSSSF